MSTYCVVQEKFEDINVVIEEEQTIQSGTRLVTLVTNTIYVCKYCVCLFVWTWHVFVFLCEHSMCLSFCVNMACVCLFAWTWHVFVFLCEHGMCLSFCVNMACVCLFAWTWHVFVFLCEHGMCLSFCVNMACVCLFAWTWHVFVFLCEHGICLSFCVNIVLVSFRKIVDIKDKLIHTLRNWECSSVLRTNVSDKRNDFNFPVVIFHLCVATFQQHLYMGYIFLHEVFFRYS
jgi:hypothetical protein